MSALTWRDVAPPDSSNALKGHALFAELINRATTGLSGAVTDFGNAQAQRAAAGITTPEEYQRAVASGLLNNADAATAASIGKLPTELLARAASKQTFDYNALNNPLQLAGKELSNATSQEALDQSRQTNPFVVNALERADAVGTKGQANRLADIDQTTALNAVQYPAAVKQAQYSSDLANLTQPQSLLTTARANAEANRTYPIQETTRQAQEQVATLQNQGQLPSAVEGNAYFQQLVDSGAHPVVLNAVKGMLEQSYGKGTVGAISTSVGGSVGPVTLLNNAAGNTGGVSAGSAFDPVVLGNAIYGQESSSGKADTTKVNSQNVTGPMQVQEATFEGLKKNGVIPANYDWKNPEHNKAAGFAHIADLAKTYKTPQQVAAVYYSGPDAVNADGTINLNRKNPERPNDPTVGQYIDQVMARTNSQQPAAITPVAGSPVSTILAQAATPASTPAAATPISGESTDIFKLRRQFQTLTQLSGAAESQDNTEFSSRIVKSFNTPMNISQAFAEIRKDPTFTNVHESTIVDALNKAHEVSGSNNYAPLAEAVKMSLSGNTEFNTTKNAPWFTGTFDYNKLERFARQAGDFPSAIKDVDAATKRKDNLAQVSFLMPQIEALNTERINLYQQEQLGKSGAASALAQVDARIAGLMSRLKPKISDLDADLNKTVKNSPETQKKIDDQAAAIAIKLKEDASKAAKPVVDTTTKPTQTYSAGQGHVGRGGVLLKQAIDRAAADKAASADMVAVIAKATSAKGLDYSTIDGMSKYEAQAVKDNPAVYGGLKPLLAKLIDDKL